MRTILISISSSLLLTILVVWGFSKWNTQKIGYIKSPVIIQEYKETKDMEEKFEGEVKVVKMNLDTLQKRYEALLRQELLISEKDKKGWAYRLEVAQGEYEKYNQQASEQMEKRKVEVSQKVLMHINEFIQKYGKENKYKLILGTTSEGSILYGEEGDDLTQIIITKLNEQYLSKEKNEEKKNEGN